ncbi:MAG: flotillin family protein [Lachnospiraceae bacterium]|nr:flotillin family protein [Lachnospiraceae bacterium]
MLPFLSFVDFIQSPAGIVVICIIIAAILVFIAGYVKAPPDMAYIISGMKHKSKVVIGRASFRFPFFERMDKLNLRLIPIDVKTSNAVPTADYININVDATVNVKISNEPDKLRLAAENFLNKPTDYVAAVAREVLEGNVREIVGKMKLEEMVSDRQKFANLVKENAEPDLAAMGLDIISFNVQNFVDGNEVIENLGIDNIVKIKKAAAIARAESERDIKVAQAAADKESNDAAVLAQTEIAKKQNELAIKKSELQLDADTKKAMADAAYEIQKEEQRKTIEITTANANIARQEREIELQEKAVAVKERALEAEIKKQAEADKYAAQQKADAILYQRQKDAEAKQFEAQREAEARKAQAAADRFAKEQEAEGIRAVGEAEAKAIEAKGLAEAQAMEKKAEAYAKYNKAAVAEMMIRVLPEIAAQVAAPLQQIDKITIIGGGEGGTNGVDQVAGNVPVVMAKVFESMKQATGIDLANIINAESYDAKVNRNINVTGLENATTIVTDGKTITGAANDEPIVPATE